MEAEISYMNTSEIAQTIKSTHLELAYERAVRQAERIYEEERVRALRVQLLLLQDDRGELQDQALQNEDTQNQLEEINDELRAQFSDLEAELQQTQVDLKVRNRDLDHLKAEVNALNSASAEATKLLSEKLALARELNTMKPELEHLRSQASIQQNLLAEKLGLQRELNSLQVELETEKRTVQRIKAQEKSAAREDSALTMEIEQLRKDLANAQREAQRHDRESSSEIDELKKELAKAQRDAQKNDRASKAEIEELKKELAKAQRDAHKSVHQDNSEIEELKKELAKAQREAQKIDREHRKKTAQWESEKEILEGKLDAFRNKLRSTKDQLTEAQDEIEQLQAAKMAQAVEMTKARLSGTTTANPRKRNVARFDPDMTIGTPGQGGPAAKKQRASVSLSDKSTFSITPFLNRTLSILPETPGEAEEEPRKKPQKSKQKQVDGAAEETDNASEADLTNKKSGKPATAKKPTASATKLKRSLPLKETTNSKGNTTMKKPQLSQLLEEDSDLESEQDDAHGNGDKENNEQPDHADMKTQEIKEIPQKDKVSKRTNIFDDEEDSASAPKVRSLGRGSIALGKVTLKAKPVGKGKTLAEFSPLKRDRRAASVL
ncbi:hypothetical protein A1O3_01580 [Capronia epimyces CBS 606.96]|uniref:Uncharacterized protein n=1 Tax=Capronia epimyces CBS 606.96 TaxID=1182542 RepID=W9ZEU5_9EURO|nr:uncharacterized protein A1O3_01580 [Capronia epimyces CBS 606.96]EXJ93024.1 hypothetical protein A1O3_01580 [Capronia epimyces CBS 606.96]